MQSPVFILVDMQVISAGHHGGDEFAGQTTWREQQDLESRNCVEQRCRHSKQPDGRGEHHGVVVGENEGIRLQQSKQNQPMAFSLNKPHKCMPTMMPTEENPSLPGATSPATNWDHAQHIRLVIR